MIFSNYSLRPLNASKDIESDYRLRFAQPPKLSKLHGKSCYYQISLHTELCVSTQTLMVNNSGKDDLFELFFAAIKCV